MNKRKAVVYPDGSRVEYGCDQGGFVRSVTDRSRFMKQGKCGYLCPAVGKEDLKRANSGFSISFSASLIKPPPSMLCSNNGWLVPEPAFNRSAPSYVPDFHFLIRSSLSFTPASAPWTVGR